jgi:2'-5' RNA ligase
MSGNPRSVRAFIAIELPPVIRLVLAQLQKKLQQQCHCPAKWVPSDSIHMTLHFLGEVPPATIENIKQAMSQAVIGQTAFELALGKLGAFPNLENPRVLWLGLNSDLSELKSLQEKLSHLLRHNGLTLEERGFYPHLTLARIRDGASYAEKSSLRQSFSSAELTLTTSFSVQDISLIQSQLTLHGPLYNTLFSAKFHSL